MKANILGVLIDKLTINEVLQKIIEEFLIDGKQHYIVTPNPEFIMLAKKDDEFKNILNQADIAIPDGFGLILASWWLGDRIPERITGVELVRELARLAGDKSYSIYLLGGEEGIAKKAAKRLNKKYPGLNIVGAEEGIELQIDGKAVIPRSEAMRGLTEVTAKLSSRVERGISRGCETAKLSSRVERGIFYDEEENQKLIERINLAKPDIIFVAFGHGKQEKWIYYNLPKLNSVKLAIGVGGTFDYLAGKVPRPPYILRRLGLEWLWRLIFEPRRWKRIFTATILFPLAVLRSKKII